MTEQLQSMLREAADDRPDLALRDDPWRRGRRMRLGRRLAGIAGAVATVTAVAAGAVLITTPDLTSAPEPAWEEPVEPTLPDTLYEAPPNVPDISDNPLGEPAAVVYTARVRTGIFTERARPVVVGAHTGIVRAVRQAWDSAIAVPSPDGTKLALAHRDFALDDPPPDVVIIDLVTGESTSHPLPDEGLGTVVERLAWAPDSAELALALAVTTRRTENGSEAVWVPGWLDLRSGHWQEHGLWEVLAYSAAGEMLVNDLTNGGWAIRGERGASQELEVRFDIAPLGAAFSPDGERIAVVTFRGGSYSPPDPYHLEIFDTATGERVSRTKLGEYADARLLGWGEQGILVETTSPSEQGWVTNSVEQGWVTTSVARVQDGETSGSARSPVLTLAGPRYGTESVWIPAAFTDAEVREASPPEAPFDWVRWAPWLLLAVLVGAAISVTWRLAHRARLRGRNGTALGP